MRSKNLKILEVPSEATLRSILSILLTLLSRFKGGPSEVTWGIKVPSEVTWVIKVPSEVTLRSVLNLLTSFLVGDLSKPPVAIWETENIHLIRIILGY